MADSLHSVSTSRTLHSVTESKLRQLLTQFATWAWPIPAPRTLHTVSMADSGALRSRRSRAHTQGDHSFCRHGPPGGPPVVVALPAPAGAPVDARVSLEGLARRLEDAHTQDPSNALLARELRMTLQALSGGDPDAYLDVS